MSVTCIRSSAILGIDAFVVDVEVDISQGLPSFSIVGLPDAAVNEAKERVRAAIKNSDLEFPIKRITINLAPADIKKEGPSFDLPIAVGILSATEQINEEKAREFIIIGELSLDGKIRSVTGVLPSAIMAKKEGWKNIIIPAENLREASPVEGINIFPVSSLKDAIEVVNAPDPAIFIKRASPHEPQEFDSNLDFNEVKGQVHVKRALEVAAAGGHNIIMVGPPGAGKTMLARRIPTILPPMSIDESLEVTKVYSISGLLSREKSLISKRPFRSPHHSASPAGLIGGGSIPKPGEVSLAHCGVLFLDELPEFNRDVLEVLRQPLEDGNVTIARAAMTLSYPASFMLVASINPCPCGNFGDSLRECTCTPYQVRNYMKKISGPLLDRIDIHIEVPRLKYDELLHPKSEEPSENIRNRVYNAREIQNKRFSKKKIYNNARMSSRDIKTFCMINSNSKDLLKAAVSQLGLSARAYDKILKVARTIADLAGREDILVEDVAEAVQYRTLDRRLWS